MENKRGRRGRGRPKGFSSDQTATVQALDRGLLLLQGLAEDGNATLSELSMKVGMPPSSVHRLLATLEKHRFASFDEADQEWTIGIEAFRVGSAFLRQTNLLEASRAQLRQLMEETGETANLGILDQGDVIFIGQVETHNPIRAFFRPGTRGPMHASGIGKAILSHMQRIEIERLLRKKGLATYTAKTLNSSDALFSNLQSTAQRGWALDDEERYPGMRCIASPIFNSFGEAFAGISISGPSVRFPEDKVYVFGPVVKRAAASISHLIGGNVPMETTS